MRIFALLLICLAPQVMAARPIEVILIVPADSGVIAGAKFGAGEAGRTAKLLGRDFRLSVRTVNTAADAVAAVREARKSFAIIGGGRPEISDAIAGVAKVPFLDITSGSRPATGGHFVVAPSGGVAWHRDLKRYGAGELNERFLRATSRPMTPEAWLGWLATKIVVEAALHQRPIASTRIDGHKGVLLRFDDRRVLQQPVYAVDRNGRLLDR